MELWNAFTDLRSSSTRCEIAAALMAIQQKKKVRVGVDNLGVVKKGTCITNHQNAQKDAVFRNEKGGLCLGGEISPLHREFPTTKKTWWKLIKYGDLWEAFANSVKAKGVGTVGLTKVKGLATNEMVAEGSVQKDDKEGNDMADDAANKEPWTCRKASSITKLETGSTRMKDAEK